VIGKIDRQACQSPVCLSPEQIDDLYRMLLPLTKRKQAIKERHINSIAQQKQRIQAEKICPRCQHGLVLRTAAKGGIAEKRSFTFKKLITLEPHYWLLDYDEKEVTLSNEGLIRTHKDEKIKNE